MARPLHLWIGHYARRVNRKRQMAEGVIHLRSSRRAFVPVDSYPDGYWMPVECRCSPMRRAFSLGIACAITAARRSLQRRRPMFLRSRKVLTGDLRIAPTVYDRWQQRMRDIYTQPLH